MTVRNDYTLEELLGHIFSGLESLTIRSEACEHSSNPERWGVNTVHSARELNHDWCPDCDDWLAAYHGKNALDDVIHYFRTGETSW